MGRMSLQGRRVLVVGGSSGIGLAMALSLLAKGATMCIAARNEAKLTSAKEELINSGTGQATNKVFAVVADASDARSAQSLVDKAVAAMGGLDVLVCCNGVSKPYVFEETTVENMQEHMSANYWASVYAVKAALPFITQAGKDGRIMLVSSQAGQLGLFGYSAYAPTKFALRGFAESLQMELLPAGTRVCLLFPPDTDTPQYHEENQTKPDVMHTFTSAAPFTAKRVADVAVRGLEDGRFSVAVGFDGWMLSIVTAGMSPCRHVGQLIVQVLLAGVMRIVGAVVLADMNGKVMGWYTKQQKEKAEGEGSKKEQ